MAHDSTGSEQKKSLIPHPSDPLIDGIRRDPRFENIMEKFRSRIAAMRRRGET
jgi:hypothetical protein